MINWKPKYLQMKLKYINAKQNAGALPSNNTSFKSYTKEQLKDFLINDIHYKHPDRDNIIKKLNNYSLKELRNNLNKKLHRTGVPNALSIQDAINRTAQKPDPHEHNKVRANVRTRIVEPELRNIQTKESVARKATPIEIEQINNAKEKFKKMNKQQLKEYLRTNNASDASNSLLVLTGQSLNIWKKKNNLTNVYTK